MQESEYPETADIETSNDDYATRFRGPSGQWMLEVQERIALDLLRRQTPACRSLLDVGGGHGQLALPLARDGYDVTVLGSASSCERRVESITRTGRARFIVGNVVALPFPDASFDAVFCFRLLTHCERWPALIKELCRVARHCVIADYPTSQSANAIAPALFGAKKKFETNTRTWTLFRHRQIREEFQKNGYRLADHRGQFFFPMVLHRMLKCRPLSAALEGAMRAVGLNDLWGSPVIVRMCRAPGSPSSSPPRPL
jgi:2-polyprenyl-3-methyl-5-hydroxy-6-metoxy-1,4-benzoquinol methylase